MRGQKCDDCCRHGIFKCLGWDLIKNLNLSVACSIWHVKSQIFKLNWKPIFQSWFKLSFFSLRLWEFSGNHFCFAHQGLMSKGTGIISDWIEEKFSFLRVTKLLATMNLSASLSQMFSNRFKLLELHIKFSDTMLLDSKCKNETDICCNVRSHGLP
jgi:hypothetical protein